MKGNWSYEGFIKANLEGWFFVKTNLIMGGLPLLYDPSISEKVIFFAGLASSSSYIE